MASLSITELGLHSHEGGVEYTIFVNLKVYKELPTCNIDKPLLLRTSLWVALFCKR